jgi:putative transcriptional regulator
MAIVRFNLDPKNPPRLSPETLARLDALTDEEITAAAESDPDNPPLTDEELARMRAVGLARHVLTVTGLDATAFAERYQIDPERLHHLQDGRFPLDGTLVAYLTVIGREREAVDRALAAA